MEIIIDINPNWDLLELLGVLNKKFNIDFNIPGNFIIPTIDGKNMLLVTTANCNEESVKIFVSSLNIKEKVIDKASI